MLAVVPKSTIGAPPVVKFAPWIVMLPEGTCGPDAGVIDVMAGCAGGRR